MSATASQIASLTIVYSTVYSGADQRKHQSFASLAFVSGIHRWPVNSTHKWPVTRKTFPFNDVIVTWRSRNRTCGHQLYIILTCKLVRTFRNLTVSFRTFRNLTVSFYFCCESSINGTGIDLTVHNQSTKQLCTTLYSILITSIYRGIRHRVMCDRWLSSRGVNGLTRSILFTYPGNGACLVGPL